MKIIMPNFCETESVHVILEKGRRFTSNYWRAKLKVSVKSSIKQNASFKPVQAISRKSARTNNYKAFSWDGSNCSKNLIRRCNRVRIKLR